MATGTLRPGACTANRPSSAYFGTCNGRSIPFRRSISSIAAFRSHRCAVACGAAVAVAPSVTLRGSIIEENVEGDVQLLAPDTVPSRQFQEHDTAMASLRNLQDLVGQMQQFSAESIPVASPVPELEDLVHYIDALTTRAGAELEKDADWDGLKLTGLTQKTLVERYRSARKEDEKLRRNARLVKRVMRTAGVREPAASHKAEQQQQQQRRRQQAEEIGQLLPSPVQQAEQQQQDDQQQTQLSALAERRSERLKKRQERAPASSAVDQQNQQQNQQQPVQPLVEQQPVLAKQKQQPAEPQRMRRRRSSSSAAAASIAATPAGLQGSSSSSSKQQVMVELAALVRGAPAAPQPAAVDAPLVNEHLVYSQPTVGAAATAEQPLSSSSTSLSVAAQPRRGFVPLVLERTAVSRGASAAARSSRRVARAVGGAKPGTVAMAASAAAITTAPAASAAKLADNNINGLDMRVGLLSADQEKELAAMVQDLLHLERAARDLHISLGRPPTDLEWMEAAGCPAGQEPEADVQAAVQQFKARLHHGRSAKQVMISANYKLVVSICRKYQGYGMAIGDLINEGIAGLVKGVERFEPSKGCKFSTYAHWWIRQSVTRSLSEQSRLVRLPSHLQEMLTKMTKISRSYEAQYGREATLQDLARELGVEASKIADTYEAVFTPRSLDQPMGDGEGATLGDVLEDERMLDAEDAAHIESLKQDLEAVLTGLHPREAGVLRMRFGLLDGMEHTLDDIGAQYNVTRERIRQIEAKAIRQLRARQSQPGSVISDYQQGDLEGAKQLASRTSSGTRKQA